MTLPFVFQSQPGYCRILSVTEAVYQHTSRYKTEKNRVESIRKHNTKACITLQTTDTTDKKTKNRSEYPFYASAFVEFMVST